MLALGGLRGVLCVGCVADEWESYLHECGPCGQTQLGGASALCCVIVQRCSLWSVARCGMLVRSVRLQVLENVTVDLDLAELEGMEALDDVTAPLKRMPHNSTGSTFLVLMREEGSMSRGTAGALLKFTVKEVDATTGEVEEDGYEDEYPLEDIEVLCRTDVNLRVSLLSLDYCRVVAGVAGEASGKARRCLWRGLDHSLYAFSACKAWGRVCRFHIRTT